MRRGAIHGDIPSQVLLLVALDRLSKDPGGLCSNIPITSTLSISDLEMADDAALANEDITSASERMTNLRKAV